MFEAYYRHPEQLPDYVLKKYYQKKGEILVRSNINPRRLQLDSEFTRLVCDHISSMTDQYASRQYSRLFTPEFI